MSQSFSVKVLRDVSSMRELRSSLSDSISLVPTMGMLHSGHMSLIRLAAAQTDSVIVSIYVNPTQLATEERKAYPSVLKEDLTLLERVDGELCLQGQGRIKGVFAPKDEEMYPNMSPADASKILGSHVIISPLVEKLEGADRPFHFVGVATICLKLFNVIKPQKAIFGEKDFQQTVTIKRLVMDFLMDIEIVVGVTIREADGLAISSRNMFLGSRRRKIAAVLWTALSEGAKALREGECRGQNIIEKCELEVKRVQTLQEELGSAERVRLHTHCFRLSDVNTLEDIEEMSAGQRALLSGALQILPIEQNLPVETGSQYDAMDSIRLIDSMVLEASRTS